MTVFRRNGRRMGQMGAVVTAGLLLSLGLPLTGAMAMPSPHGDARPASPAIQATAARLVASPSSAKVGGLVTFTARGFRNYGAVDLQIKASGWQTIATGAVGNKAKPVVMTAAMPNLAPGLYQVRAVGPGGAKPTTTVTIEDSPSLNVDLQAKLKQTNDDGVWGVGDSAQATVAIVNNGNVPLQSVAVTVKNSDKALAVACDSTGQLAVADRRTCTTTVKLTAGDIEAGSIPFTAAAKATGAGEKVGNRDNITVYIYPNQKVNLSPNPIHPGDAGTLTAVGFLPNDDVAFTMTPTSGGASTSLGSASADRKGHAAITWTVPATLAPAGYSVLAKSGTERARTSVQVAAYRPHLSISAIQPALRDTNGDGVSAYGDEITVHFTIINDGDVAVSDLAAWGSASAAASASASALPESTDCADLESLAPKASVNCMATIPLTSAELNAGAATVTVNASGNGDPSGGATTASVDAPLDINQTRALSIDPGTVQAGHTLEVVALGFLPTNTVTFTISSGNSVAFTSTDRCDDSDRAAAEWRVPADQQPGRYTVTASEPGGRITRQFTVTAGEVTPRPHGTSGGNGNGSAASTSIAKSTPLAGTGASVLAPMMAVAAAIAIGGLALTVRRRRGIEFRWSWPGAVGKSRSRGGR